MLNCKIWSLTEGNSRDIGTSVPVSDTSIGVTESSAGSHFTLRQYVLLYDLAQPFPRLTTYNINVSGGATSHNPGRGRLFWTLTDNQDKGTKIDADWFILDALCVSALRQVSVLEHVNLPYSPATRTQV